MEIDFEWNRSIQQICGEMVEDKNVQLFLANEAKRLMEPYVPSLNNQMARNVRVYVEDGKGIVHYLSVQSRYQYEGKVMVDPVTGKACFADAEGQKWSRPGVKKVLTGRDLNYTKFRHPLATSHWDKAMLTARQDDLTRATQAYIRSRG